MWRIGILVEATDSGEHSLGKQSRRQGIVQPFRIFYSLDRTYAIAFLVEARSRTEKQMEVITEGLAALDDFVKRLGKADLIGDGVQKLKQKDIEALLADLTENLPEMVPGLP